MRSKPFTPPLLVPPPESLVPRLACGIRELAAALGVAENTVRELAENSGLPCFRAGRRLLFPIDLVRTWLAAQARSGAADGQQEGAEP